VKRQFIAVLLAFSALLGGVTVARPAVADDNGVIGSLVEAGCGTTVIGIYDLVTDGNHCEKAGTATDQAIKQEWTNVWNSVLGDWIKSGEDFVKAVIRTSLTFALQGPSLKLEDTGLWGEHATLAGMLVWLGLLVSVCGVAWHIGKMAITGQAKHVGRAMAGWVQNTLLCAFGLSAVALLLTAGDEITDGLVNAVFGSTGAAYDRISAVLVPVGVSNPAVVAGGVCVLLLIGFIQLLLIFLRNSAIPIQCLLLPIAGAGRTGGEATRQWAPRLITSILVGIAYKPVLAVIICTGFVEFGKAGTVTEWLRGVATLALGILAPGPLMKIFAPLGAEAGSGMAAGGAIGAVAAVGAYAGQRRGGSDDGGAEPTTAVEHARHVERTMGNDTGGRGQQGEDSRDALAQAARNQASQAGQIPNPGSGLDSSGSTTGAQAARGFDVGGGAATAGAGLGIQVLDGINSSIQRGANEMGNGGGQL
jgi:hypothetical protein